MKCRRYRKYKVIKNRGIFISLISLILILILSLFIANNLASIIYRIDYIKKNNNSTVVELNSFEKDSKEYIDELSENNLVLFQAGVFTDLENAENFKENILNKSLVSIVNDGKYERVLLGFTDKQNYLTFVNMLKKHNIQFIKQIYKISTDINYNVEIFKILGMFTKFILNEIDNLSNNEFNLLKLKKDIEKIQPDYGDTGLYKEFNALKELIMEFDHKVSRMELESVIDFVYSNFSRFKI